jgi:hypothetical protein
MNEKRIEERKDAYVGMEYIGHWAKNICHITYVFRSVTVIARNGHTGRCMSREAAPQPMHIAYYTTSEISSAALSATRSDIYWLSPLILDSCSLTPDCKQLELQLQQNDP